MLQSVSDANIEIVHEKERKKEGQRERDTECV